MPLAGLPHARVAAAARVGLDAPPLVPSVLPPTLKRDSVGPLHQAEAVRPLVKVIPSTIVLAAHAIGRRRAIAQLRNGPRVPMVAHKDKGVPERGRQIVRYGFLGVSDVGIVTSFGVLSVFILVLYGVAHYLVSKGIGLRT